MNDNRKLFYSQNIQRCISPPTGSVVSTTIHPRWDENATHYGTNNFNLSFIPGGYRIDTNGVFQGLGQSCQYWTIERYLRIFSYQYSGIGTSSLCGKKYGLPIRLLRPYDNNGTISDGTVLSLVFQDPSGNNYDGAVLGNYIILTKNLHTSKYYDGSNIPEVTESYNWKSTTSGAWCNYDNSVIYGILYGKLYNYYAIEDSRKLFNDSAGWRVPSINDISNISYYLRTKYCPITVANIAIYLKSERQVNHPLIP